VREFSTILLSICDARSVRSIKMGYAACRELFLRKFMPELLEEKEDDVEKRPPSPKKVKFNNTPELEEVFEYTKPT